MIEILRKLHDISYFLYNKIYNRYMPTKFVFRRVYLSKKWHSDETKKDNFNSGSGSDRRYREHYVKLIKKFAIDHKINTIVDLGCGDFRVGEDILNVLPQLNKYIAVDIVPELIAYNKEKYNNIHKLSFICSNIINEKLPVGDLYLIRQVFQHLSNNQISKIIDKIHRGSFVLVTEHQPNELSFPNIDKTQGADIRLNSNSGVYLDKPPFNYDVNLLLEIKDDDNNYVRTFEVIL